MKQKCPTCGQTMVPVVYGLPGGGAFEAAERGEIVLGGCGSDSATCHLTVDRGCPIVLERLGQ